MYILYTLRDFVFIIINILYDRKDTDDRWRERVVVLLHTQIKYILLRMTMLAILVFFSIGERLKFR